MSKSQNWASASRSEPVSCLIIGAGLAGLTAAGVLQGAGIQTRILEMSDVAGGRLATLIDDETRGEPAVFDHGAQFFTVREEPFAHVVEMWRKSGIAVEWSRGFATADGSYYADGHPRYRGSTGMTSIAKGMAFGLDIRFGQRVERIAVHEGVWQISAAGGLRHAARALILTPPVPQSLALLDASDTAVPGHVRRILDRITYEPCIAVMLLLDGPSHIPEPGGMWPLGEPLAWLADNHHKGISPAQGAVTLHAGPEFSQTYWRAPDEEVAHLLKQAAEPWLGGRVVRSHVRRWPHSKPLITHSERCLHSTDPAPIIFAGDAFAGPRVEGAVLSGLAAAQHLLP